MSAPAARSRGGFTLVEMAVVLLVLAVIVGATLPAFLGQAEEDDMMLATRRIESLFRFARDSAARGGAPVDVVFDSANAQTWLGGAVVELDLPRSVTLQLSAQRARFTFLPTGAAFADSLLLTTSLANRLITVNPWTGDAIMY